ncbi:hypothetical protein BN938_1716 [Mucinivorans hirudinis]|uniref:Lipoprotein n=1 Tax=Mucinivorans hirudinis TaxID=1433126 RepID=A0A060R8H0_9BACT|nr:hypothetical protein BN938_1716 [Mucinivorans hirudinis]
MKKIITTIFLSLTILVSVSSCSLSKSPSEKDAEQNSPQSEIPQDRQSQKVQDDSISLSDYLLYASLGLNVICIFLLIFSFKKLDYLDYQITSKKNNHTKEPSRRALEQYPHSNPRREIEDMLSRFRVSDSEINRIEGIIWNRLKNYQVAQQNNAYTQNSNQSHISQSNAKKKLYASQCNSNNNTFYNVTENPCEGTVYELAVADNMAEFALYEGAVKKVIDAPDFLVSASDLQIKENHHTARTDIKGKATLKSDGSWAVETKARIIFE